MSTKWKERSAIRTSAAAPHKLRRKAGAMPGVSLSAAGSILPTRAQWHHLARGEPFPEARPSLHQLAPLLEKIAATVGSLHLVPDRVCERHFDDLAGVRGALRRPIRKGRAEAVRRQIVAAHA